MVAGGEVLCVTPVRLGCCFPPTFVAVFSPNPDTMASIKVGKLFLMLSYMYYPRTGDRLIESYIDALTKRVCKGK